jgi:hypothetical protein
MKAWTVLRDCFPLAPDDSDLLGQVVASDRESARRQAERIHGKDVLVAQARSWPVRSREQSGVAADEDTSALQHRFALGTSVPAASSLSVSDPLPGGDR